MKANKHTYKWYYYTRSQRYGFVCLVVLFLLIQGVLLLYMNSSSEKLYRVSDTYQQDKLYIDSIYRVSHIKKDTIYPFNPNFISDFKGMTLGMTPEQIDRLHAFRKDNKYVNSVKEFQQLTKVSDEWIMKYKGYFKFPDWVVARNNKIKSGESYYANKFPTYERKSENISIKDINTATEEDLQLLRGIGPGFSKRIIQDRDKYGGYVSIEQVKFVYYLPDEVIESVQKYFVVKQIPSIIKINVNSASIDELKKLPYMNYYIAREIVKHRSMNGNLVNKNDLSQIEKFPLDKIDIISLYLDFKN
ncbi:MAG: helix-hairpin-helix domain-containing protein [Flavobacteriaceae bacterium]|jgi:DNA uptake protein ComE-like DNA-binding protein|nr:helix-hairpin-helix domain-containing protein [Flavobacteriaceae bacterium]